MQQKPIFKRLVAIGDLETVFLGLCNGIIEVFCREIVLVEHYPALVISPLLLLVSVTDADGLAHKTGRVHGLAYRLYRGSGHSESLEIIRLRAHTFTYDEKRLLYFPRTLAACQ